MFSWEQKGRRIREADLGEKERPSEDTAKGERGNRIFAGIFRIREGEGGKVISKCREQGREPTIVVREGRRTEKGENRTWGSTQEGRSSWNSGGSGFLRAEKTGKVKGKFLRVRVMVC